MFFALVVLTTGCKYENNNKICMYSYHFELFHFKLQDQCVSLSLSFTLYRVTILGFAVLATCWVVARACIESHFA
jgi:hypothetical protein